MSTETRPDGRPRGWARAWGETWRLLVALVFGLVVSLSVWFGDPTGARDAEPFFALFVLLDVVVGITVLVLLPLRHRAPLVLTLVAVVLAGISPFASCAASLMLVSLATRRRAAEIVPAAIAFVVSSVLGEVLWFRSEPALPLWQTLVAVVVVTALIVVVGLYVGGRRELLRSLRDRARLVEEEEQLRLAQARDHERTRIAREMHDVLAHRLSLVALHAGALEYRDDLDAAETRATAGVIRENARTALTELRDVLGVLREPGPDGGAVAAPPQPTLAGLEELLDEARSAGMAVQLESSLPAALTGGHGDTAAADGPDEEAPPTTTSRHAFRIVQECLTNARRHAPGQLVTVTLDGRPGGQLVVRVENALGAAGGRAVRGGHGLDGLAERARLAGGTLTLDSSSGRHVVEARLPWTR
ncbi:two-component sensor histidine kinase [Frigoribacterium sp. ACAM 257]|uniref:sensor histidine kinase n=1 Tax=Frigoribacterium sp. ACAM 257 TaxID=2508998 RepID=UPI0011B9E67A|nr:histidine kinase [Frigoribacterium sp. ACAM 257]TWX37023.1 two-component sensor histidine kinase [Frigoribacterium sp. ACAM 257]